MAVDVSAATPEDTPALVEMGRAFFDASGFERLAEFDPVAFADLVGRLPDSGGSTLVARDGARIVGMAGVMLMPLWFAPSSTIAHELFWWVQPDDRKSGAGRALLRAIEEFASEAGAQIVGMSVLSASEHDRVTSIYRAAGYQRLETAYAKRVA